MTPLMGRPLAEAAHAVCRDLDPEQHGVALVQIQRELVLREVLVAGSDTRKTLGSSLNKHQDLFRRVAPSTWAWTEPTFDPQVGLSGAVLAEEAYFVLSKHPEGRTGLHYENIKELLQTSGVKIRGGNPGNTLFTALQNADEWFEWTGSGTFRLK